MDIKTEITNHNLCTYMDKRGEKTQIINSCTYQLNNEHKMSTTHKIKKMTDQINYTKD